MPSKYRAPKTAIKRSHSKALDAPDYRDHLYASFTQILSSFPHDTGA